jgi:hypothetical protein
MKRIAPVVLLLAGTLLSGEAHADSIFLPGNLVVSVEGDGSNTGTYTDNQAAPLTLYSYGHSGTSSAALTGSMMLSQTASGANHAISGEYGSSSEGGLQLTGDGHSLLIAGYGVNATAFNNNPSLFGPQDPTKPNALAQSSSSLIPRVIAVIGADGSVDTSTALTNVFNGNNPRSVASFDGSSFYISGQGLGTDQTAGVFYTLKGASTATAITGDDTSSVKGSNVIDITQDTRAVRIVNGQLVVATDSKGGSDNAHSYIGTLGTGLPTTDLNSAPAMLPGFGNTGGTGKQAITFATGNGINVPSAGSASVTVNLSPNDFFFADPNTLYVADSGHPKNDSAVPSNAPKGAISIGDGGLQKWVRDPKTGQWSLEYTLSAGLNLVADTAAAGTTGLLSLTGELVNGEVELFATNYTIGDTDPTFLFGITDLLSATSGAGESFTVLATAAADTTFKGVAFAPTAAVPEPQAWALMLAGFGLAGAALRRRRRTVAA